MFKKKLFTVIVASSIVSSTIASPLTVTAQESHGPPANIQSISEVQEVNPNLIKPMLEARDLGNNTYALGEWNTLFGNKFDNVGWTKTGENIFSRAVPSGSGNINATFDNNGIKLDLKSNSGTQTFILGQELNTVVGKEYTASVTYNHSTKGDMNGVLQIYTVSDSGYVGSNSSLSASGANPTQGTLKVTFKANTSKVIFSLYNKTAAGTPNVITYSDIAFKKSDSQQAQDDVVAQNDARAAVNALFENKNPKGNIVNSLTQEAIDNAQKLVDKVTSPAKKAELQADLDKAQNQLTQAQAEKEAQDKAREAVNNLFENKDPNGNIITDLTQEAIDNAQTLVNQVTDPTKKAELQADLDKAKSQLAEKEAKSQAEKEAEDKAREAVNNLFENKNPKDSIIKGLTQEAIDDAQKLVDEVMKPEKKAELQADLDKAKAQLATQQKTTGTISTTSFAVGVDKYITGTYTGDVARISMIQDGTEFTGASVKNGAFTFYATDKKIKKDHTIVMVAYDKYGKELAREQVAFIVATEGKITPSEITIPGDKNIIGTYTGDVAKIEVTVNGKVYKGGTVANGTFQFYSLDKVTKPTDVVSVNAFDNTGKLLDTKTVKIKTTTQASGTVQTEAYTIGDKNIVGTYTGDTKSVIVTVNSTPYKGGTFNEDGTFKFYAFDKIKSEEDIVTIQALDKTGKILDTKTINLQKIAK